MRKLLKLAVALTALLWLTAEAFSADMTWQQCVDEAVVNNPGIIAARAKLDQAKANSWLAVSGALPQVSASAGYGKNGTEPAGGPYASGESYSYSLRASQLVFDWFATLQDMMAAGENEKAAEMNYRITSAQIRYGLMQAYAGLMKAREQAEITGTILKLRTQQLADIQQRYKAGREHKGSLMSVEADFKQAQFDADQAIRDLSLAKMTLGNALGRDNPGDITLKVDFSASTDPGVEPDFEKLFESNPNVMMLIAQKNAAANNAGSAASAFLPSVNVSAGLGRSAGNFPPENTNWSLGVNVSLPLLDGGRLIAQSAAAQASLKQAEANLRSGQQAAMLQLKDAWSGYRDAAMNLEVQKTSLDAYKERAMIADAQYTTGLIAFNDWTIIQNGLVNAQKSYISAQANLLIGEAAWIQAKGGMLEDEKTNK